MNSPIAYPKSLEFFHKLRNLRKNPNVKGRPNWDNTAYFKYVFFLYLCQITKSVTTQKFGLLIYVLLIFFLLHLVFSIVPTVQFLSKFAKALISWLVLCFSPCNFFRAHCSLVLVTRPGQDGSNNIKYIIT